MTGSTNSGLPIVSARGRWSVSSRVASRVSLSGPQKAIQRLLPTFIVATANMGTEKAAPRKKDKKKAEAARIENEVSSSGSQQPLD